MSKESSIIIVGGAGTFGLSTAWHLARAGYTKILCLDRWPVPSPSSAGYDLNKIVRTEYSSETYTRLAHEALELWRDPLFADVYHETGWIFGTDGTTELGRAQAYHTSVLNTKLYGDPSKMVEIQDWNTAVARFPFLVSGQEDVNREQAKENFQAIFNGNAGWVDSTKAMKVIQKECSSLGVQFLSGTQGTVVEILWDSERQNVVGVQTQDGCRHLAGKVILAAGSYSDTLLDFEGQLECTAYVVTHLKMTEEQYHRYKDMPVINISRRGYMFPPKQDRLFKVCNTDVSYLNSKDPTTRIDGWGSVSVPRDQAYHPTDTQPTHGHDITQRFLEYILPEFADGHQVHSSRLCWDAEVHDYNWIITPYPKSPASFFAVTGGSGHSFKNIVNVGKYVVQMLEGTLDKNLRDKWRWRPDTIGTDPASEERARRPKLELMEAVGWNHQESV